MMKRGGRKKTKLDRKIFENGCVDVQSFAGKRREKTSAHSQSNLNMGVERKVDILCAKLFCIYTVIFIVNERTRYKFPTWLLYSLKYRK